MMKPLYQVELVVAAARRGWARPSVAAIARAAGVSEATARHVMLGRSDLVAASTVDRVHTVLGVGGRQPTAPRSSRGGR